MQMRNLEKDNNNRELLHTLPVSHIRREKKEGRHPLSPSKNIFTITNQKKTEIKDEK